MAIWQCVPDSGRGQQSASEILGNEIDGSVQGAICVGDNQDASPSNVFAQTARRTDNASSKISQAQRRMLFPSCLDATGNSVNRGLRTNAWRPCGSSGHARQPRLREDANPIDGTRGPLVAGRIARP